MIRIAIVSDQIDVASILQEVDSRAHGASILFVGTVREMNAGKSIGGMDYSAYTEMAEREMMRIATEASDRFAGTFVVVVHRVGELAIGDASVAIATSHAHRDEAYLANRYVIEQLKQRVPIWKREHYMDGTRDWVHNGIHRPAV